MGTGQRILRYYSDKLQKSSVNNNIKELSNPLKTSA